MKLNHSKELFSFPYKDKFKSYYSQLEINQSIKIYFEQNNGKESTNDIIQIESDKEVILPKSHYERIKYFVIAIAVFALILTNYLCYKKLRK